jgi:negative regulator of sigma E activity
VTSEHVTELLSAYIDGELSDSERERVERHLEHCEECRDELEELRQTAELVGSLPQQELPEGFRQELRQQLLVEATGEQRDRSGAGRSRGWTSGLFRRVTRWGRSSWVGVAAAVIVVLIVVTAGTGLLLNGWMGSSMQDGAPMEAELGSDTVAPEVRTDSAKGTGAPGATTEESSSAKANGADWTPTEGTAMFERKVIRTAQLEVEVEEAQKAYQQLVVMTESMGGYVQESTQRSTGERLSAHLILRVPETTFRQAIERISELGKIKSQHMSGQDVTEEYVDLESRSRTLSAKESRLMDILAEAKNVDEILKIERELWSVREKIEQLQGRLRYLDHLTSLATLQVNLVEPYEGPTIGKPGLIERLVRAFNDSIEQLGDYTGDLLVGVVWVLPYAVVLTVVVWIMLSIVRWRRSTGSGD